MKLSVIIDVLKLVAAVAVTLRQLILAAEELFPEKGSGSKKFAYVKGVIFGTAAAANTSTQVLEAALPVIEKSINDVVAAYNEGGTLPK